MKSEDFAEVGHWKPINFLLRRSPGENGPAFSQGEAPACDEFFRDVTQAKHFRHPVKDGHVRFVVGDASHIHLRGVVQVAKLLGDQRVALHFVLRSRGTL